MFDHIGKQLRILARVLFFFGLAASAVSSVLLITQSHARGESILPGICVLLGGILVSWITSLFLYGFGEIVDRICDMDSKLNRYMGSHRRPS